MSILATDKTTKETGRRILLYLFLTLFFALLGAVYELFSHGVYSYRMIYAFGYPLVLGLLPALLMHFYEIRKARSGVPYSKKLPGALSGQIYDCGVFTLTIGSAARGALEIYGTTNRLCLIYAPTGCALILTGLLLYLIGQKKK
ncbi:MAG: hypothetical protein IJ796_07630 [Lachnospiraceae bacterium]|nr:hypothetical protein [Lachnospiraceae bacterium]